MGITSFSKQCFLLRRNISLHCMKGFGLPATLHTREDQSSQLKSPHLRLNVLNSKINCFDTYIVTKNFDLPYISYRHMSSLVSEKPQNLKQNSVSNIIDLTENTNQDTVQTSINILNQPEVSLTALNLASNYSPIGWCLHYFEFLHSVFPWWGTIAIGTLLLRIAVFPIIAKNQKYSAKLHELLPEQNKIKDQITQARSVGDTIECARLTNELHSINKRNNINPLKAALPPLIQLPAFLTFFLTLRRISDYPVESLKTGGFGWITDLSIPDPYYVLPLLTSLTLWASLEISFRTGINPNQTAVMKYSARILPLITFVFTYNFSAAILTYWCTNNFISIGQVLLLKNSAVRTFFDIPQLKFDSSQLKINKKSFKKQFKDSMETSKINRILDQHKTIDEITFKKAGIGPLKKTYKHNPIKLEDS